MAEEEEIRLAIKMVDENASKGVQKLTSDIKALDKAIEAMTERADDLDVRVIPPLRNLQTPGGRKALDAAEKELKATRKAIAANVKLLIVKDKQLMAERVKLAILKKVRKAIDDTTVLNQRQLNLAGKVSDEYKKQLQTKEKQKELQRKMGKQAKKDAGVEEEKGKSQVRTYTVMSKRGIRTIATMRGTQGVIFGILLQMGQMFIQNVAAGMQKLVELEKVGRRIALLQMGGGLGGIGGALGGVMGGLTGGGMWKGSGVPTLTGATMEQLRMQSGLDITDEQLIQLGVNAETLGEKGEDFLKNFVKFAYDFDIASEDFNDAIALFTLMAQRTPGGTGAIIQQMGGMAPMARQAGWDFAQIGVIFDAMDNAGVHFNNLSGVIQQVIEDDNDLSRQIIGMDGNLRTFDEVIDILILEVQNLEKQAGDSSTAIALFGFEGYEAIKAIEGLRDETHNWTDLQGLSNDLQVEANQNQKDLNTLWKDSTEKTMNELDRALSNLQMSLAQTLQPAIEFIARSLTGLFDWLADLIEPGVKKTRGAQEAMGMEAGSMLAAWLEEQTAAARVGGPRETRYGAKGEYTVATADEARLAALTRREGESLADFWNRIADLFTGEGGELPGPEPPESPILRTPPTRRAGGGVGTGSTTHITHNYITVHDNDRLLRDMIRVNINV